MKLSFCKAAFAVIMMYIASFAVSASTCIAEISVGHVDNFQDGTTQHWRLGQTGGTVPNSVEDEGPLGVGDYALYFASGSFPLPPRAAVINESDQGFPGPGNWQGNWTAAGVTQISLDVRNGGTLPNTGTLTLRLGISGPGPPSSFGEVYITDGVSVPRDNNWHSLVFDVLAADFQPVGIGTDVNAALAAVTQFRIIHQPGEDFRGELEPAEFYLDNIRAIGASTMVPGDYNGNGEVDAADYVVWRKMLNQSVTPGSGADGTGPGGTPDGVVNDLDYSFWRSRFGSTSAAGSAASEATAVPEPTAWTLVLFLMPLIVRRYR